MFWFFGLEACGILAPRPGIEPAPPALEDEVLTTGPPGKSLKYCLCWLLRFFYAALNSTSDASASLHLTVVLALAYLQAESFQCLIN